VITIAVAVRVRVVTPLSPSNGRQFRTAIRLAQSLDWKLEFPCAPLLDQNNRFLVWSDEWSDDEIDAVKKRDDRATTAFSKPKSTAKTRSTVSQAEKTTENRKTVTEKHN